MERISEQKQKRIIELRRLGLSIPEIVQKTNFSKTTVTRYVSGVPIPVELRQRLKEKQGGAKERARGMRENVLSDVTQTLSEVTDRDRLFLLIGLYWGEGTKKDFGVINSDPALIQAIITSLKLLNIHNDRLALSLRVHNDISVPKAKAFWAKATGMSEDDITMVEVIEGKKKGKLEYGMCRIRVKSGIRERLFIQTAISLIGKESAERVVSA
jgi:hypothetical protein